ncbi:MAG: hypothetical protein ACI8WM_002249 [Burkholderiaceae bacterium]|jgi:hypothetical protein
MWMRWHHDCPLATTHCCYANTASSILPGRLPRRCDNGWQPAQFLTFKDNFEAGWRQSVWCLLGIGRRLGKGRFESYFNHLLILKCINTID